MYRGEIDGQKRDYYGDDFEGGLSFEMGIPKRKLWKGLAASYLYIVFMHHEFSDHILPFIFFTIVFIYCGFGSWDGNLVKLLSS